MYGFGRLELADRSVKTLDAFRMIAVKSEISLFVFELRVDARSVGQSWREFFYHKNQFHGKSDTAAVAVAFIRSTIRKSANDLFTVSWRQSMTREFDT